MRTVPDDLLVLGRDEVATLLDVEGMLGALEAAFVAHSEGRSNVPPRVVARTEGGLLGAMPGYVEGVGLAAKLVSVFPGNALAGGPSHQGVIVLFDEGDGRPLCLMDGQHITAMRTAGGSAISVRHLAREDARVLAILGAGVQGASHLAVVPSTRRFDEIRVASRNPAHASALAAGHRGATVAPSFEAAARDADVVCCCTDADDPVLFGAWLAPGTHVTSVGSGAELDASVIGAGPVFVEWRGSVTNPPPAGAPEVQGMDPRAVTELGEVMNGSRRGRTSADQVTVYRSTGHATEDVATARLVFDRAIADGVGTLVRL